MRKNAKEAKRNVKSVCVVGLGHIGLPTACFLAKAGFRVIGVDKDKHKIDFLKKGKIPFEEPGLLELFRAGCRNLEFSMTPQEADDFIIAVPTPIKNNKAPDLTHVVEATHKIHPFVKKDNLIVIESTVPAGTIRNLVLPILNNNGNLNLFLAYAPERAMPGRTLREMAENCRVIGGINEPSNKKALALYSSFVKGKIYLTTDVTAELVKLIENTYRDVNIAFANELAKICEEKNVNVWELISIANLHPRVNILWPGPGVGGHCICVDPWFLLDKNNHNSSISSLITTQRRINDSMPDYVFHQVSQDVKHIAKPRITILGAAYKADVDDWRETPALRFIHLASKKGWTIKIHDRLVKGFPHKVFTDLNQATKGADALVVITDHRYYKELDPRKITNMKNKYIYDSRRSINEDVWEAAGFKVRILGKPKGASLWT